MSDDPVQDALVDEEGRRPTWLTVDEAQPVRLAPVAEPAELDGFRLARVFDAPTGDGRPFVDPARGLVTDVEERRRLLRFLESGTVIRRTGVFSADLLAPHRIAAVPGTFRTDGRWIWDDSVTFYLRWHLIPPEPEFRAHIVAEGYRPAPVTDERIEAATRTASRASALRRAAVRDWMVQTGQLAEPSRFPFDFQERLLALGWRPGRDISGELDTWLAEQSERLRGYRLAEKGYPPYEAFEAARRVLVEFGGLASRDNGSGITSARVPFRLLPGEAWDARTLTLNVFAVVEYGKRLGQRVFQVGVVEDGTAILVVAQDGSVRLAGSVERFVAPDFDTALVALMDGNLPADEVGPEDEDDEDAGFDWDPDEAKNW